MQLSVPGLLAQCCWFLGVSILSKLHPTLTWQPGRPDPLSLSFTCFPFASLLPSWAPPPHVFMADLYFSPVLLYFSLSLSLSLSLSVFLCLYYPLNPPPPALNKLYPSGGRDAPACAR